jgi:hypothetical protein
MKELEISYKLKVYEHLKEMREDDAEAAANGSSGY